METLAGQIKKDNALCISDAQKLRFEFDSAVNKIRVMNYNLYFSHCAKFIIIDFRKMKILKQLK